MWYSARLLYESVSYDFPAGYEPPAESAEFKALFEDSLVVFKVEGDEDVIAKLKVIALGKEDDYEAAAGNRVKWVFREILEIQDIMSIDINDGTEVYFRWWINPTKRDFRMMRDTHEPPWWPRTFDGPVP